MISATDFVCVVGLLEAAHMHCLQVSMDRMSGGRVTAPKLFEFHVFSETDHRIVELRIPVLKTYIRSLGTHDGLSLSHITATMRVFNLMCSSPTNTREPIVAIPDKVS
jgi:hypothetical protein